MKPSQDCFDLIRQFEGCRLTAYQDVVGVWTIGWGHTGDVTANQTITQDEADSLLQTDVDNFAEKLEKLLDFDVPQCCFDAMTCFAYNVGLENFRTSTLRKLVNDRDYHEAAGQFIRWNKAGGKVLPGLTRRRLAEASLFARDLT